MPDNGDYEVQSSNLGPVDLTRPCQPYSDLSTILFPIFQKTLFPVDLIPPSQAIEYKTILNNLRFGGLTHEG